MPIDWFRFGEFRTITGDCRCEPGCFADIASTRGLDVPPLFISWFVGGAGVLTKGIDVLLIVIELFRDCHVAFGFDRTTFGELFLPAASLSDVGEPTLDFGIGRPNVLYCGPVGDGGIGLSVMLLLRLVFVAVDMLKGRLVTDTLEAGLFIVEFAAGPVLEAGLAGTVTGVTVTDEFIILRGNVGDDAADVEGVECIEFVLGEARRSFCCCRAVNLGEGNNEISPLGDCANRRKVPLLTTASAVNGGSTGVDRLVMVAEFFEFIKFN